MAITSCHFDFYTSLRSRGLLPQGGSILEIGQANWYGDKDPFELLALLQDIPDPDKRAQLVAKFHSHWELVDGQPKYRTDTGHFDTAELFYDWLCSPTQHNAIDLHGTPKAHRIDLNDIVLSAAAEKFTAAEAALIGLPRFPMDGFDTVINNGTAEHIFHIAQVFRTIHKHSKVGGLMIHDAPFCGWVDHGFYTLQPTLFYDVARQNNYEILAVWLCDLPSKSYYVVERREAIHDLAKQDRLPKNGMLLVAFRKTTDADFQIPMQGIYAGEISEEAAKNWRELR